MNITDVPIWEKYTLTIEEASKYFRIGENKLRKLAEENPAAGWVIMNGNRIQIKRKQFEKFIDTLEHDEQCRRKDEITGTAFYAQERAREKTEDMLTNI